MIKSRVNHASFYKTYLKGEFSYGFWHMITRLFGVATAFLTIYSLSIRDYGVFQLALATYSGMASLLYVGAGVVRNDIIRFEAEGRSADAKKIFWESFGFKLFIGVVLWAITFFSSSYWAPRFGTNNLLLVRLFSLMFLHDAIINSFTIIIEMRKKFNASASRAALSKLIQLIVLLYFFFYLKIDLMAVIISIVISSFGALLLFIPVFIKAYYPWKKIKMTSGYLLLAVMTSYGKWEFFQPILGKVTSFVEPWAIKLFVGTEAVAIVSIAQTLIGTIAGFFPLKTFSTLIPLEINNEDRLRKVFTYGIKYLMIFAVLIGLVSFFIAPVFLNLFFEKYLVSLPYFNALLFTLPFLVISAISGSFVVAFRRQKFLFFMKVLKTVIAIPLYLILLPLFDLWGLIIQNYLLSIFMLYFMFVYLEKMTPRLYVKWYDVFRFREDDKIFLKNIIGDVGNYFNKKYLKIIKT